MNTNQLDTFELTNAYKNNGLAQAPLTLPAESINLLNAQFEIAMTQKRPLHYDQLVSLHNPWGRAAQLFDSWSILDICLSQPLLDLVESLIGPNIILWESAFIDTSAIAVNKRNSNIWHRHADVSPITPMQGVIIRVQLTDEITELSYIQDSHKGVELITSGANIDEQTLEATLKTGELWCQDIQLVHQYVKSGESTSKKSLSGEFFIHYMPSTSLFERDPSAATQQKITEQLPLINYAKSPLWQARGEDHANNNFAIGFSPPVGQWTNAIW